MSAPAALQEPTIIDVVVCDHRNVQAMMQRCLQAAADGDKELASSLATAVTVDVVLHSRAEEAVLYPFMERRLGQQGHKFSEHSNQEHQELEARLLVAVAAAREGDVGAMEREMLEAQKAFEHHRHDEEDKYLPRLLQEAGEEELRELTAQWTRAKQAAGLQELSSGGVGARA